mgnify:CR=1 FL=1
MDTIQNPDFNENEKTIIIDTPSKNLPEDENSQASTTLASTIVFFFFFFFSICIYLFIFFFFLFFDFNLIIDFFFFPIFDVKIDGIGFYSQKTLTQFSPQKSIRV